MLKLSEFRVGGGGPAQIAPHNKKRNEVILRPIVPQSSAERSHEKIGFQFRVNSNVKDMQNAAHPNHARDHAGGGYCGCGWQTIAGWIVAGYELVQIVVAESRLPLLIAASPRDCSLLLIFARYGMLLSLRRAASHRYEHINFSGLEGVESPGCGRCVSYLRVCGGTSSGSQVAGSSPPEQHQQQKTDE